MAKSADYRLGKFTFPRGWFMIATEKQINTGKPLAVRFLGRDFALYRGLASGRVVLLDAYCPHMQTHLAAKNTTSYVVIDNGGTNIVGDDIVCPYHAWRFGPDGKCTEIPYHDGPIPSAAKVKAWPVEVSMGAVWVWHDTEDGEPDYPVPSFPESLDPAWVQPTFDDLGVINVHPVEVIDNIADFAHFYPVHGYGEKTDATFENEFIAHKAIQRMSGVHRTLLSEDSDDVPKMQTITTYHGPGALQSYMIGNYESIIVVNHTPVDDGTMHIWHALWVKSPTNGSNEVLAEILSKQYQDAALTAFKQDFEIWKAKGPNINGMYLPSDGAFQRARAWYKQFYQERASLEEIKEQFEGERYVPKGVPAFSSK